MKFIQNFILKKKFLPFIFLSPAILWLLFHPKGLLIEMAGFPQYAKTNISSLFAPEKLMAIEDMRWNAFGPKKEELPASLIYNKGFVLVDNFFSYLSFFSPRYYFQAGDGTNFSPPAVDPIAGLLFLPWVFGVVYFLARNNFKIFWVLTAFGLIAFLAGKRNLAFLSPILLIYLFLAYKGIEEKLPQKIKRSFLIGCFVYGLFLLGRMLWFTWTKS